MGRREPERAPPARTLRAVVTDIDGTITDPTRRLDSEAVRLLRELEDQGTPVILATGNVLPIALAVHRSIGLNGPIVAENGGLLYSRTRGVDRIEHLADRRVAWAAFEHLRSRGLRVRRLFTDRWRETEVGLEPNVNERTLRAALRGMPVTVEGTGFAVHLMERGAGKLPALRRALAAAGLAPADCLIAGDGDNDVAMLRAAGWGVSFANGSPKARRAADFVSRRSNADGFVEGLMRSGVLARSTGPRRKR